MKPFASLLAALAACMAYTAAADAVPFERLNVNDTMLLIVDEQVGLLDLARDFDGQLFFRNMIAHAAIGTLFDVPVIMTTSEDSGPNGPMAQEVLDMYPNMTLIRRQGEINAWDNPEFRKAVEATGRKQIVMAGIVTEVCTTFLALSLREEGYSVWANVEASGTTTQLLRDTANARMQAAGVQLVGLYSIVADLFRDWRNAKPTAAEAVAWLNQYAPAYGTANRLFMAAQAEALAQANRTNST